MSSHRRSTCRRPTLISASAVLFLSVAACAASEPTDELLTAAGEYETTGAVVVSHDRIPPSLPLWRIAQGPELRIGRVEGQGPDIFGRIASIVTTTAGDIVVADTRALEIRAFDSRGRFRWRAGSEGEGPGEFRRIDKLLLLPDDSILVLEDALARATLFNPAGEHVRTWRLHSEDPERTGRATYRGVLQNGVIVATILTYQGSVIERDHRRLLHTLTYIAPDGSLLHEGPKFFGKIRYEEAVVLPQPTGNVSAIVQRTPAIANQAVYAVGNDRVAVGAQGTGEIIIYDGKGVQQLIVKHPGRNTRTDRRRFVEHAVAAAGPQSRAAARQQAERDAERLPSTLPAFDRVVFDGSGRLWVEDYVPPYEHERGDWLVLDRQGTLVARARFPVGFDPHVIGREWVIGVTLDDLDVATVERRLISRSGTP